MSYIILSCREMNEKLSLNTHDLDGKWREMISVIKRHKLYFPALNVYNQIKRGVIPNCVMIMERKISPISVNFFKTIIAGQGNWDSANNIDALFLLCFISVMPEDTDLYTTLSEQLFDLNTGACPQGRTTRIAQVIFSYLE